MDIKKCDFCKKEITHHNHVLAGTGFMFSPGVELCYKCGEPILKFLRKHKIIDKNNNEIK